MAAIPGPSTFAQEQSPGSFETYQKAFAKALESLEGENEAPSGPVWLQPEALGEKEACTTCHLGVNDNRFLNASLPYRRHRGHYLDDHPPEQFGCITCHGGIADGLTFDDAGHPPPADASRRRQWEQFRGWSPPGSEGMVPLKWMTGRCALCHAGSAMPEGAEPYRESRDLVAEKRCTACHQFRDEPVLNVRQAVRLDGLAGKVNQTWLTTYLRDPSSFRHGTGMPAYDYPEEDLQAISAYLLSLADPTIAVENNGLPSDAETIERGRQAVRDRRCLTCHDIPGEAEEGFVLQRKVGPSLAGVGEKLKPNWIRSWLEDPHATRPDTGMPRFRFKDGEIESITAFLLTLRSDAPLTTSPPSSPTDPEQAAEIIANYSCTACHSFADLAVAPPPRIDMTWIGPTIFARLAARDTDLEYLEGPDGLFHQFPGAPRLFSPDESFDEVLTFLAGQVDLPIADGFRSPAPAPPAAYEPAGDAARLVKDLRCLSCHTIRGDGGDIGPDLTHAGSKLKRDWLIDFLQSPEPIRPMNRARMPNLGLSAREAETLADWIMTELKAPEVDESQPDFDSAFSFVGAARVKSPYGCFSCHRIGEEGGAVGPELTHVSRRLQTKWIYHWLKNPKHWVPDVRMPNFEMSEEDLLAVTLYLSEKQ